MIDDDQTSVDDVQEMSFQGTTMHWVDHCLSEFSRYQDARLTGRKRFCTTGESDEAMAYAIANSVRWQCRGAVLLIPEGRSVRERWNSVGDASGELEYLLPHEFEVLDIGDISSVDFSWLKPDSYSDNVPPEDFIAFCEELVMRIDQRAKEMHSRYERKTCGKYFSRDGGTHAIPGVFNDIHDWFPKKKK